MPEAKYLFEARDDIDETFTTYESKLTGLGERFLAALKVGISLIEDNPLLFGEVAKGIRAAPLRRFPQVVYYRPLTDGLLVIAVRHGRDDPAIWSNR